MTEVWCETFDDIVLIWGKNPDEIVEFVQVKSDDLGQYWSISKLCSKERKTKPESNSSNGTTPTSNNSQDENRKKSILETSLAHDNCSEEVRFRIVTQHPVNSDLAVLVLPLDHPDRKKGGTRFDALVKDMKSHALDARSPRDHDYVFWLSRVVWSVLGQQNAVRDKNKHLIHRYADGINQPLTPVQLDEIYSRLLLYVKNAADADWKPEPARKKIQKEDIHQFLTESIRNVTTASPSGSSDTLRRKMTIAGLPETTIETAVSLRRNYLKTLREPPSYLDLSNRQEIESEVLLKLHRLRERLYSGEIEANNQSFHTICLDGMDELHLRVSQSRPTGPSVSFYVGCMYDVTNRCAHRFDKEAI